jgi:hypothetical protein
MITSPADLIVGTNLTFDFVARTFELPDGGSLVAKDGVDMNVLWSKFVALWDTAPYKPYPFPMNKVDNKSGQYVFGRDPGGNNNGWKPGSDATRNKLRNGGAKEYSSAGVLNREYFCAVNQGSVPAGSQCYYQKVSGGAAIDYPFTDLPNAMVQVFGDASNGNFDSRTFFKTFNRTQGYTYDDVSLDDINEAGTGAWKLPFSFSTSADLKISDDDATVSTTAPYTSITIGYYTADQNKTIGAGSYPFRMVIDNSVGGSLREVYTKMQYLLRQNSDINEDGDSGVVTGKTADLICWFVGDTLYSRAHFVPAAADLNSVVFIDKNSVERIYPYASAGTFNFNTPLTAGGTGSATLFYKTTPNGDDYAEGTAIVVKDKDGNDIDFTITGASIPFSFDYSSNTQGGYAGATDRNVVLVWGNPDNAKPGISEGTITQSKGISISAVAEVDPSYIS